MKIYKAYVTETIVIGKDTLDDRIVWSAYFLDKVKAGLTATRKSIETKGYEPKPHIEEIEVIE